MLHLSLEPVPIISSLINGFPIRWICRKWPAVCAGSGDLRTVICGRDVVPQDPIVAAGSVAGRTVPVRVSMAMGTSIAMVLTL